MTTALSPTATTGRVLKVALIYAERGWPVFPCKPQGKTPITEHGLKDASTDPDRIHEWWERTPDANVAIATGVAFDVLDVDGAEGFKALGQAIVPATRSDDDWWPSGPTVTTGKGAHCYFAATGLGNRAGVLPGVDWRGKGGYVIAAPSVHPSGTTYRFQFGSDDPDYGVNAPLAPPPPWLRDLLNARTSAIGLPGEPVRPSNVTAYGRRALEAECGRVALAAEGERNHTLNQAAFAIGQLVGAGALPVDPAADALGTAAARAGLDGYEAQRTIASGLAAGAKQPRRMT
ncbi:MAG: bifunctional DNA primase/polymerase [Acidimicrobiales bacterium]